MAFNTNNSINARNQDIDFVRGVCIVCMFFGHCGVLLGPLTKLWNTFFMPAFFIFSGYFFRMKSGSTKKTLLYKTKKSLGLYYLWAFGLHIVMGIIHYFQRTLLWSEWFHSCKLILLGIDQPNESAQLWFLVALFSVELMWILIVNYLPNTKSRIVAVAIIASLGVGLNSFGIKGVPFRFVTAMIMLPLFAVGVYVKEFEKSRFVRNTFSALDNGALWYDLLLVVLWGAGAFVNVKLYGRTVSAWTETFNFHPLYFINAVTGTLVIHTISKRISQTNSKLLLTFRKAFCFYGKNSVVGLLTINFLIYLIMTPLSKLNLPQLPVHGTANVLTLLIVLLLLIPLSKLLNNPKISKYALLS